MDLNRIASAIGCTAADIVAISDDLVTLADGSSHTFADPRHWGLEEYAAKPAAKPVKPTDPA